MHPTALISGRQFFDLYCANLEGAVVVDVGSQNVNGSLKDVCPSSVTYIGVDFVAGHGVDIVLEDPYKLPFGDESIDAVVCSSCFEHCEMFWLLFLEILRILKPSGLFYLNTPSNGMFHQYPVDCWRFYPDSGHALVSWAKRNGLAPVLLESFISRQSPGFWNDFVAVFLKDGVHLHCYPNRMIDARRDYYNGYATGSAALRCPEGLSEDEMLIKKARSDLQSLALEHKKLLRERDALVKEQDAYAAGSGNVPARRVMTTNGSPPDGLRETPKERAARQKGLVSIVILTFNQLEYTQECVESIRRHTPEPHEILFVDNGSTDGTVPWLRQIVKDNPHYSVIENAENLGFSKGCNQGIAVAAGDYILLLNNDVVVTAHWLSGMLECLNRDPDTGIVGPMTNNISGLQKVPAADCPSSGRGLDEYAAAFRERNRHRRIPMRRIVGFCMLFRRTLADRIGLLDERFGSGNFEDDDFCLRAALLGYTNVAAGDVFIHHHGSRSFIGNGMNVGACLSGNRKIFTDKWSGIGAATTLGRRFFALQAIEEARKLHAQGRTRDALQTLHLGITRNPADRDLHRAIVAILMDAERLKKALDLLRQTKLDEGDLGELVSVGYCHYGLDALDEADAVAERVLTKDPTSARAMNLKGMVAFKQDNRTRAGEWFRRAMAADPGYGEPCKNLGTLEWAAGRRDEALRLIERGFILSPQCAKSAAAYHAAVITLGAWDRAEKAFAEARSLHPADRRLACLLIDILRRKGGDSAALDLIRESLLDFGIDDGLLAAALEIRKKVGSLGAPPPDKRGGISVCMIVKDEERNLPRCLMSLRPLAREVIVVDTGSTDRTREVAAAFGARVFEQPWTDDFSAARNASLEKAAGDWILVVDADEVIAPQDLPAVREMTGKRGPKAAWAFTTRNYVVRMSMKGWTANDGEYEREEAGTGWSPSRKVRLFPNHRRIRFENRVHELVEPSLNRIHIPIKESPVPIHHYGKLDRERTDVKGGAYYDLGKKKIEERGESLTSLRELAIQAQELKRYDEALELWQRVIRLKPDQAPNYLGLCSLFLEMERFDEALAASKTAMEIDPSMREVAYNYALCELYAGDAGRAAEVLKAFVRRDPDYPLARILLPVASFCAGDRDNGTRLMQSLWRKGDSGLKDSILKLIDKLVGAGRHDYASALLKAAGESRDEETGQLLDQQNAASIPS